MAETTTLRTEIIEDTLHLFTDEDHPAFRALASLRAELDEARAQLAAERERRERLEDAFRKSAPNKHHKGGPCWCGAGVSMAKCDQLRALLAAPSAAHPDTEGGKRE